MKRECGSCTLCCRLVPVKEIGKKASTRCPHQRHGKGCAIYADRPLSCRLWNCGWLQGAAVSRPDRTGYVLDPFPDVLLMGAPGQEKPSLTTQVWCDPKRRDAWRDPDLLKLIELYAHKGIPTLIRFGSHEGLTVFAPALSADGQWHEVNSPSNFEMKPEEAWQLA